MTTPTTEQLGSHPNPSLADDGSIPIPSNLKTVIQPDLWGKLFEINEEDETPPDVSEEQATTWMGYQLEVYRIEGRIGRELWSDFQADFIGWTTEIFSKTNQGLKRRFRNYLAGHGVWINPTARTIAAGLADAVTRPTFHIWKPEEVEAQRDNFPKDLINNPTFIDEISVPVVIPFPSHLSQQASRPNDHAQPQDLRPENSPQAWGPQESKIPTTAAEKTSNDSRWAPTYNSPPVTSKQLTDLAKLYADDMKYGGEKYDILDTKLAIFYNLCDKISIEPSQAADAFPFILKGRARDYYFDRLSNAQLTLPLMVERLRGHFESHETRQAYLTEWRQATLIKIIRDNPSKTKMECLEALIDKITKVQRALPTPYQSDLVLRDQLVNACQGVEECRICLYNPATTAEDVLSQLRSAISTAAQIADNDKAGAYWTDRTYHGKGRSDRFSPRSNSYSQRTATAASQKKCYVCAKPNCWSTRHSDVERRKAYSKFKSSQYVQGNASPAEYSQFLTWYEGDEDLTGLTTAEDPSTDDPIALFYQSLDMNDDGDADNPDDTFFTTAHFVNPPRCD
ncbi:glycosyl transferase [Colletotrichum kahawae]|uniref:Glycosyl transferase n=1 Tax=Colletotrichum kahawae TaxID=34407 RepID=A0AAD9YMX3_COLKA|nr:glycosyl transferase [Colletotrichum kahawae]